MSPPNRPEQERGEDDRPDRARLDRVERGDDARAVLDADRGQLREHPAVHRDERERADERQGRAGCRQPRAAAPHQVGDRLEDEQQQAGAEGAGDDAGPDEHRLLVGRGEPLGGGAAGRAGRAGEEGLRGVQDAAGHERADGQPPAERRGAERATGCEGRARSAGAARVVLDTVTSGVAAGTVPA
jgi:hypothetical protein